MFRSRWSKPRDSAIASLSVILGVDASGFDPDGQLPPLPETC